MSRVRKRAYLALVVMLAMFGIAAEDSVFIGDGDIGGIRMYDSQGVALDVTVDVASNIGQGWILHNPDSPILIITPKGSINLYENSILITGDLISNNPSLYLVKGKATFNTYNMQEGTLSVSTPVSLFKLHGDGEMFVISDDDEESVTVFRGEATSFNSISRATRTIGTFQKLGMQESRAKVKPIAAGYYLSYATYPDLMLAKQLLSEMATTTVDTPSVPKFSSVLQTPQELAPPIIPQGLIIMPSALPSFAAIDETEDFIPPKPYTISVTSEPIKVPSIPQTLSSFITPRVKERIVVTIKPLKLESPGAATGIEPLQELIPEPPSITSTNTTVVPVITAEDEPSVAPVPEEAEDEPSIAPVAEEAEDEPSVAPVPEEAEEEPGIAPVAEETVAEIGISEPTATEIIPPKQEKPQALLYTQEKDTKTGSFGLQASYSFLFDGTDNNSLLHTLSIKPYVTYKSFALTLQSSVSTDDFSTFTSNATPVPNGTLEMLSYGFNFISSLRFGYSSSPFFLALDNNLYHLSLNDQFFAPRFGESNKLGLFSRIEMGPFSSNIYFDDLYLTNLLANKHQFASFSLEYAKLEGYRFSASLGTLARMENSPTRKIDLYPNVNFLFPLIDIRTTQLSLLLSASGYLPAYPNFEFDKFVDLDLTSLFPNYQLSAGLSLKQGVFSAKLLGSLREGENRNLLTSDLGYAIDTSYNSLFDIFAETGFAGEHFNASVAVNIPFTSNLTLADGAGSHKADFSQITLSYKQKGFTFSFGLQEVGIVQTITSIADGSKDLTSLFGGGRATSFLSAGYSTGGLTLKAKAAYPADPSEYTTPKITITASYKFGMQF